MTTMIRPGLLVALKTTVRGGVQYERREIEPLHLEGEQSVAQWETTRTIRDAEEFEEAGKTRGKCRTVIQRVCCYSSFGLLCPTNREDELRDAIKEAEGIAREFNKRADHTRVDVMVLTGRIADNDAQAARAILSEVRDLLGSMEAGVKAADPDAIRESANKARMIAGMLTTDAQKKVSAAINEVRSIATEIVKRVEKQGETAASVVEDVKLEALKVARFAVLDLDDEDTVREQSKTPVAARSIDITA